jgi:hypothetical protein
VEVLAMAAWAAAALAARMPPWAAGILLAAHVGGFARPGVAMNGGHWSGGWGHRDFRHGFRGFGYDRLFAYARCDPCDPYAYGACNGYADVW